MKPLVLLAASCLVLAACQQQEAPSAPDTAAPVAPDGGPQPPPPAAAAAPTLTPSGAATPLETDPSDELQWAASVVSFDELPRQTTTVKLFGVAGGDPAMNGLQTFIAFYVDPSQGWRTFRIGDFLAYRVIGEAPGRVDLEIDESDYNDQTGQIGSRTRRLILTWTDAEGDGPEVVEATDAR